MRERWGRDVLHCPYCHGWEVRDRAIAILATGPMSVHQALLFRQLSDDVTFLSHAVGRTTSRPSSWPPAASPSWTVRSRRWRSRTTGSSEYGWSTAW